MDHDSLLPEQHRPLSEEARVAIDALQAELADLLRRVVEDQARLVLTLKGQPVAVMVPYEDFRLIQDLEDQVDAEEADKALTEAREHGTIPWDQVKRELGF